MPLIFLPYCVLFFSLHCCYSKVQLMGGGIFFKVGGHKYKSKNNRKFLWFELASVMSQALKYDAINFCQEFLAILCNVL